MSARRQERAFSERMAVVIRDTLNERQMSMASLARESGIPPTTLRRLMANPRLFIVDDLVSLSIGLQMGPVGLCERVEAAL